MRQETSLYLDIVRIAAALVVFLGHLSGHRFTGGLLWQLGPVKAEAVTIFFVLSGFVIGYVTDRKEVTAADYAVARVARIYSVALPALLVTFVLDTVGHSISPAPYDQWQAFRTDGRFWQYVSGLFFLNEIWFSPTLIGSNIPYWSIGFEVWYYAIFGIAIFAPPRWRVAGVAGLVILTGPRIAVLFPLWLMGLMAYRIAARRTFSRWSGTLILVGSTASWLAYETCAWRYGRGTGLLPEIILYRDLGQDYIVGVLFALHVIGFNAIAGTFSFLNPFGRVIRWVAGGTFSLYLMHMPIAQFLSAVTPGQPQSWLHRIVMIFGTLASVYAVAEFTERRKAWWRRGVARLLMRTAPVAA